MPLRILCTAALILCITSFAPPKDCARISAQGCRQQGSAPAIPGQVMPGEKGLLIAAPHAEAAQLPLAEKEVSDYTPFLSALFV